MKKVLSVIIAMLLVFSLVACNSNTEEAIKPEPSEVSSEANELPEASEEGEQKRILFINVMRALDFFVEIENSVIETGEAAGYIVDCVDANADYVKEADQITQGIIQKYDLIMICGDDSLIPSVDEANEAGIPILNYDAYIGGGNLAARVSTDNAGMGRLAAEYIVDLLKEQNDGEVKGNLVGVTIPSVSSLNDRYTGFREVIDQYPDVVITEAIPKDQYIDESQKYMDNVLISMPDGQIDIIFGTNSGTALGSVAAVEAANRKNIKVVGIDDEEGQITALQDANSPYYATIAQNPTEIGKLCIEASTKIFNGEEVGIVGVGSTLVTKDTVEEFLSQK